MDTELPSPKFHCQVSRFWVPLLMVDVLVNCMVPVGRQAFPKLNPATGFGLMVMGFENNVLWQPEEVSTLSVTVKFPVEVYVCN